VSRQRQILPFLDKNGIGEMAEDIFVNITLYRVPGSLVREFALKVCVHYPGGISEAVQELMKKAIKE
jgi:hypothetical protein